MIKINFITKFKNVMHYNSNIIISFYFEDLLKQIIEKMNKN
jgi:hypothetical protein